MKRRPSEAEDTLDAIRNGQVDAIVVARHGGNETLAIEGTTHPYWILLNAMSDGAGLLEPDGSILFANRKFAEIAGARADALTGSAFQNLFFRAERPRVTDLLRDSAREASGGEFLMVTRRGATTPIALSVSLLPLADRRGRGGNARPDNAVLMLVMIDLTYQRAAEQTRNRLLERLIAAEDDERRRIARELHDETGQSLAALLVGLRLVADLATTAELRRVAKRLRDVAAGTVGDVGRLARGLHPAVLDDKGLVAAATRFVSDFSESHGTRTTFVAGSLDAPRLAPVVAATMYRILQEAMTNVARHAKATTIAVELTRDAEGLGLLVRDNGIGFDVLRASDASGLGLRGMRERVTLLGGSIAFESAHKRGTSVRAHIPITKPPARRQKRRIAKR